MEVGTAGCCALDEFVGGEGRELCAVAGPRPRAVKSTMAPVLKKTCFIADLVELRFARGKPRSPARKAGNSSAASSAMTEVLGHLFCGTIKKIG